MKRRLSVTATSWFVRWFYVDSTLRQVVRFAYFKSSIFTEMATQQRKTSNGFTADRLLFTGRRWMPFEPICVRSTAYTSAGQEIESARCHLTDGPIENRSAVLAIVTRNTRSGLILLNVVCYFHLNRPRQNPINEIVCKNLKLDWIKCLAARNWLCVNKTDPVSR